MYDRETGTLWSHLTGEAISGPLQGQTLTMLQSVPKVKWETWRDAFPHTQVLSVNGQEDLIRDAYTEYHISDRTGLFETQNQDARLRPKDMVIGVKVDQHTKAYPLGNTHWKNAQNKQSIQLIQDDINGIPIVVYFDANTHATAVYDRRHNGQTLTFSSLIKNHMARDTHAQQWNMLTGQGPRNQSLVAIPHLRAYWFAWVDFYPQTHLYEP